MIRTEPDRAPPHPEVRTPTVLAVLIVKDGMPWLRDCLQGLSSQTYGRLGILAVDNGSTDGSRETLERALGSGRVLYLGADGGVGGAVQAALEAPVAAEANYLLIVHDDTALEPDSVVRLVDAAEGIEGVGVVGPKVVDWEDPRILREVGRSTDRFGHPYTPLQDGEVDHGQYDRVLEVLFVSSCAMLVRRDVWQRAGVLDERLTSHHEDLDFCWRARLAGFRIVMTPLARVRHESATAKGRRTPSGRRRTERYYGERASLASMLKNYGVLSLAWLFPLYAVIGAGRALLLALSRRFEDAYEIVSAWGWNAAHLPGTIRLRRRAQSVRSVKDREIRRFMEGATLRVPRWLDEASAILADRAAVADDDAGEPPRRRLRAHTWSFVRTHPVLVGSGAALVLGFFLAGPVLGADPITGGAVAAFPSTPASFFTELVSGVRTTALGGPQPASPALAALGVASWLAFASPSFAQRLLIVGLPFVAAVTSYRAAARQTGDRLGAIVAAAAYGLSPVVLWAFSQGRIDLLVALAALPPLVERLGAAFGGRAARDRLRLAAGIGVAAAIGASFLPGILLPAIVATVVFAAASSERLRGLSTAGLGLALGVLLVFPLVPDLVAHAGPTLSSFVGVPRFSALVRAVLGPGPGSWGIAWFLPLGALASIVVVRREHRRAANRLAAAGVVALFLAWLSAAGYLPDAVSNPPAYVALLATSEAALIGYGASSLASGFAREAFGIRQILAVGLLAVLVVGLSLQALAAVTGEKAIGQDRLPPAWPVVSEGARGDFRVLWLGRDNGAAFPAPGGDPAARLDAGRASVRYSLTGRHGVSALDIGRSEAGPGYDALERTIGEILAGGTQHGGALLAPFGVRYVVAASGDLPPILRDRLDAQLDLDRVPALGLTIYRAPAPLPPASAVHGDAIAAFVAGSAGLGRVAMLDAPDAAPLRAAPGGWTGDLEAGSSVYLADQFASGWRLSGAASSARPSRAFGWGVGFGPATQSGSVTISYDGQWVRTLEIIALALLWGWALWITRRPMAS
jgi:GT2 family glycosyltransferase